MQQQQQQEEEEEDEEEEEEEEDYEEYKQWHQLAQGETEESQGGERVGGEEGNGLPARGHADGLLEEEQAENGKVGCVYSEQLNVRHEVKVEEGEGAKAAEQGQGQGKGQEQGGGVEGGVKAEKVEEEKEGEEELIEKEAGEEAQPGPPDEAPAHAQALAAKELLAKQRGLFAGQLAELQRVAQVQLELTGEHPLKDEMLAMLVDPKGGGSNGGRRKDVLSEEATRVLCDMFSLKDAITKAEVRGAAAAVAATPTQVKDLFYDLRGRVRAFMSQAERYKRASASAPASASASASASAPASGSSGSPWMAGIKGPAGSAAGRQQPAAALLELLQAEPSFAGQALLLQALRRTRDAGVLTRLVELGGVRALHALLLQALAEEQTSVIRSLIHV
eukprot:jgi/Mesen1/605/ME000108S10765